MEEEFGNGFRMLVVEDDDAVAAIVTQVFHAVGFAVDVAWNLKGARERVDTRPYDLVLLDKDLPDGSGLELARYLTAKSADCEILLMTAHGSAESAFEAFELGLADYIPKPFENLGDLRARIRKALKRLAEARRAGAKRIAPPEPVAGAATGTESHRRLRFFVEMRVRFILVDGSLTGPAFVSQLSISDLFVETDRPLALGSRVRMRLYLPGRSAVDVRGVVRRHGEGPSMMGMRIEFTDIDDQASFAIANHLAPQRATLFEATAASSPSPEGTPPWLLDSAERPLSERFTPEAFQIFFSMHRGKLLDFLDTLDTATVEAILAQDARKVPALSDQEPAKTPAPFEAVSPALFDPENVDPEALPLGENAPGDPAEPADEEERLRRRYGLEDDLLDESVRKKYGIDESLFDDGEPAPRAPSTASPPGNVLSRIGESPEQRTAFAVELRRRGEEALARGMVLKAASDLALAVAFDSKDEALQKLYARVRAQANAARAEDLYRQGLQQGALGDLRAASRLLLGACELAPADPKYLVAASRVLLQSGDGESLKSCRTLLRDAITRMPDNADLHVLLGKVAECEGQPKAAARAWQRALEINPGHAAAKELLARGKA